MQKFLQYQIWKHCTKTHRSIVFFFWNFLISKYCHFPNLFGYFQRLAELFSGSSWCIFGSFLRKIFRWFAEGIPKVIFRRRPQWTCEKKYWINFRKTNLRNYFNLTIQVTLKKSLSNLREIFWRGPVRNPGKISE